MIKPYDHGFSKACPTGNHMLSPLNFKLDENDFIQERDGFCRNCGRPLNGVEGSLCDECTRFDVD